MGNAPIFKLFPMEKFEEFKTSIHSMPRIYKKRILGIIPKVREVNRFYEFINTHTTDITYELDNIVYDLEDVTSEFIDIADLGTSASTSIGYNWFNEYLIHKKRIDLFSEPTCMLNHSTDSRGGKIYYAVYSHQQSTKLLKELNLLRFTKKSFDKFSDEIARQTETAKHPIASLNIKMYYLSAVTGYIHTKAFLARIDKNLMGLLVLPPEYM